jgi:hypothetical protein
VLFLLRQIPAQGKAHQRAVARPAEARFATRYHAVSGLKYPEWFAPRLPIVQPDLLLSDSGEG